MLVNDAPPYVWLVNQLGMNTRDEHVAFEHLLVRTLTTTYHSTINAHHADVERGVVQSQ